MKNFKVLLGISLIMNLFFVYLFFYDLSPEEKYIEILDVFSNEISYTLNHNYLEADKQEIFKYNSMVDSINSYFDSFNPATDNFVDKFRILTDEQERAMKRVLKVTTFSSAEEKEFAVKFANFFTLNIAKDFIDGHYFQVKNVFTMPYPISNDTINLGEEYIAYIPYLCAIPNYKPTIFVNGDTIPASPDNDFHIFREKPNKKGLIKHDGFVTFYVGGKVIKLSLDIEYFVK